MYTLGELLKEDGPRTKELTLSCGSENGSKACLDIHKIPEVAIKIVL
jgi:hypothetical protein